MALKRKVEPVFLRYLEAELSECGYSKSPFAERIYTEAYERLDMGQEKYKQDLTTDNGRNPLVDAWEEAFDGAQYLIQAFLEGRVSSESWVRVQVRMVVQLYAAMIDDLNRRHALGGETETDSDTGQAEGDAIFC